MKSRKKINRNNELFQKFIVPNLDFIDSLVGYYCTEYSIIDDIRQEVKEDFYRYIHTYDESRPLDTWIHICTKRKVFAVENRYRKEGEVYSNFLIEENMDNATESEPFGEPECPLDMAFWKEHLSDDVYNALCDLKKDLRYPLLMLCYGYSVKDITKYEYERGSIQWHSVNAIKTRIKIAKETMIKKIGQHEIKRELVDLLSKISVNEK